MPEAERVEDVTVAGPDDVWALGNRGDDGRRPFVRHRDGEAWSTVTPPRPPRYLSAIAPDGAGGVWITSRRYGKALGPTYFLHRDRSGRWTEHNDVSGEHGIVEDMELVPGTRTLWAVGSEAEAWPVSGTSLVERYDPPAR